MPGCLVSDHYAALGQDQLDIAQAEAEDVIQPHGVADNLGWEAVTMIGIGFWRHPGSFARLASSHQPWLTWQCPAPCGNILHAPMTPIYETQAQGRVRPTCHISTYPQRKCTIGSIALLRRVIQMQK
jgi:hypothetical protein